VWNDLPVNVVDFRSLPSFKRTMSKHVTGYTITLSQFIIIVNLTTLALPYVCIFDCPIAFLV